MKIIMTAWAAGVCAWENTRAMCELDECLDMMGYTAQKVRGFWKGDAEPSRVISGVTDKDYHRFLNVAEAFQQEAVLLIRDDSRAVLYVYDRESPMHWKWVSQDIGDYRAVPREIAIQFDAYTHDEHNNEYFVAATHAQIADKQRRLLATHAAVIAAQEYEARCAAVGA